ncbi:ECF transporter S component [Anaerosacchariphilus polymeriproducens]|uniref:ECF transporter S component n=1 Tax=Anaerosacchariphilus polymeriproducens TaxID=1812858 RepID=A0A371ARW7_9FIRM|nr:ECF transporter S component [Anaerosacchariphilus polymeriproducens]RDU22282.1 ECF transporter S component [Anaerosacchariphilus polymeriproducens]
MKKTNTLVIASLLASLTCIATTFFKINTPPNGYIHLGDGFVLLSGALLGPYVGGLAAGTGSMLADIFSGYAAYAPATFIIKALAALTCGFIYQKLIKNIIIGGILGEIIVIAGYFLYDTFLKLSSIGEWNHTAFSTALLSTLPTIPLNCIQGIVGIVITVILLPIVNRFYKSYTSQ